MKLSSEQQQLIIQALESYIYDDKESLRLYQNWYLLKEYPNKDVPFVETVCLDRILELQKRVQLGEKIIIELKKSEVNL